MTDQQRDSNYLDGLADHDFVEHEEMLEWMDDEFDSEAFDADALDQKLAKVR